VEGRVVFNNTPDTVIRRLKAAHPPTWANVLVGEEQSIISIVEYVNREKFEAVEKVVRELVRQGRLPLFTVKPERLDPHIRKTVKRIIELMQGE
jgi:hypothetical protein